MPEDAPPRPADRPGILRRAARLVVLFVAVSAILLTVTGATGCMERLFYVPTRGATPPPAGFPGAERVTFASADGTRLVGWFLPAFGVGDAVAPSVLHVHGNAGNIENHLWFSEFLPRAGFNLFLFDYRGYGESEGKATRRADLIADTNAALDALLARPDVDPSRVALFGQSLGGAIGLNVMAEREEVRCGVVISTFTAWPAIAGDAIGGSALARGLAKLLIRPGAAPIDAVARLDRPILLVHGADDAIIPVEHGRRLADANERVRLVVVPGADHNDIRDVDPDFDSRIVEFLRESMQD